MSEPHMPMVKRRAVFLVGGYERNDYNGFFRRIRRELERFKTCWSVGVDMGETVAVADSIAATAMLSYKGPDGECQTDLTFLNFDDIVKRDGARPFVVRLYAYVVAFFDYVFSGTMFRFFATNWRFALYFLYPMLALLAFAGAGIAVFKIYAATGLPLAFPVGVVLGLSASLAAGYVIGSRYFVFHLMDLWSFSREHLRLRRPEMDKRLDDWAQLIRCRIAGTHYDEVIPIGHSTGGAIILDLSHVLSGTLRREGMPVNFHILTVGSTSLKIALHPAAKRARSRLTDLANEKGLRWTEFQSLTDIINFYKCDPFRLAVLSHDRSDLFPRMFQVRFREMLLPDAYKRVKRNFFRVHYQFISANSRRYFYDFFMICCGTARLETVEAATKPALAAHEHSQEIAS